MEGTIPEVENGFMRHGRDIEGLADHLKELGIIPPDAELLDMMLFDRLAASRRERSRLYGNSPIYGYYINLDERGEFYADVRDLHGTTVYTIKSEDDDWNGDDGPDVEDDHSY